GTHQGEFLGIAPTGKPISAGGMSIYRIADGKIAEEWTLGDLATVLQQIGAMPAPTQMAGATT
ncbi:MAG: ester cyclase, partial [Chloroflexota bacterium]|nr:ester cyclase [Chloroflexota bacterium]